MRTSNYHKKIKLSRKTIQILAGSAAGLVLAAVIFFFVYFHVENVEVMVSDRYTEEEIKEMVLRGPLAYNSVLAPGLYSTAAEDIPFVEGFEVRQVNRNTIAIGVIEKDPVGCIPFLDCYMYFDRSGKIIESSTERDQKIPFFEGLEIDQVVLEEELAISEESVLNTAVSLARIFEKNELIPDHIYFSEQYEISLEYGNVTVMLGKDSYLEDKMARLVAILPQIRGQKGILHMENITADIKTITFEQEKTGEDGADPDSAAEDGSDTGEDIYYEDGSYGDSSYEEDYTEDGYTEDSSYEDGYTEDGSYEDGYTEDGSYEDGSYEDGAYEDGSDPETGEEELDEDDLYENSTYQDNTWGNEPDSEENDEYSSYEDEYY